MRINGRLQNSSTYHVANEKITNQTPAWCRRNEQHNQSARAEGTFEGFQIKFTKSRHILDHETNLINVNDLESAQEFDSIAGV